MTSEFLVLIVTFSKIKNGPLPFREGPFSIKRTHCRTFFKKRNKKLSFRWLNANQRPKNIQWGRPWHFSFNLLKYIECKYFYGFWEDWVLFWNRQNYDIWVHEVTILHLVHVKIAIFEILSFILRLNMLVCVFIVM